ncbi:ScbR family autoregulator-binding transcription factor [Streptomyces apocyni]|uniref:ScbR family autoregulator-binding transcription factor n=1 Tax=Streptomyces apocyni TaxID=2654677 RepID=UPI0012EA7272|nr:ScbR family autoregulator-binding transcription factor [Streptomyces apocyni]
MSKQERAVRTRSQLIVSAARAFRQHGYTEASMTAISRLSGVSSGALYFHFPSKAALAEAVETEASHTLHTVARRSGEGRVSGLQALVDTSHALAQVLRENVVAKAGLRLNCDGHASRLDLHLEWQTCVHRLLTEAARDGWLNPELSRQHTASAIVAATVGFEVLSDSDQAWISRGSLTGFWQLQLPRMATPEALGQLDPAGSESAWTAAQAVPRVPEPAAAPTDTAAHP